MPDTEIYLDIDGVAGDFYPHLFKFLDLPEDPPTRYEDPRFTEHFPRVAGLYEFWKSMPPLVKEINHSFTGWVTHRPDFLYNVTVEWLQQIKGANKPVITLNNERPKSSVIKPGCYMLEDAPHNYEHLREEGVHCYLRDQSYNQHIDTPYRVFSINEFFEKIAA